MKSLKKKEKIYILFLLTIALVIIVFLPELSIYAGAIVGIIISIFSESFLSRIVMNRYKIILKGKGKKAKFWIGSLWMIGTIIFFSFLLTASLDWALESRNGVIWFFTGITIPLILFIGFFIIVTPILHTYYNYNKSKIE